jgi:hypothetical protein
VRLARAFEAYTAYVRRELAAMMGEDDERVDRWDELCERHRSTRA